MTDKAQQLKEKLVKLNADLVDVKGYYEIAEKIYPYSRIRDQDSVSSFLFYQFQLNDHEQRLNEVDFENNTDGQKFTQNNHLFGVATMLIASKLRGKPIFSMASYTHSPVLSAGFFMLGISGAAASKALWYKSACKTEDGFNNETYLHRRANEVQKTHSVVKVLDFHLSTRLMKPFSDSR